MIRRHRPSCVSPLHLFLSHAEFPLAASFNSDLTDGRKEAQNVMFSHLCIQYDMT